MLLFCLSFSIISSLFFRGFLVQNFASNHANLSFLDLFIQTLIKFYFNYKHRVKIISLNILISGVLRSRTDTRLQTENSQEFRHYDDGHHWL